MSAPEGVTEGDCFMVAFHTAERLHGRVVHGLPLGKGSLNLGKRYWHAWVEVYAARQRHSGIVVVDIANGRNHVLLPVPLSQVTPRYADEIEAAMAYDAAAQAAWGEYARLNFEETS
jgi:hypothetical protein